MSGDERRPAASEVPRCEELVARLDWSATPLGPRESWPRALETTVRILLASRHPMFLWWGESLVQIYNDAYAPSFGVGRHPSAMGQLGEACWRDIWPIIHPQIDQVMTRGEATWNEDHLVPIERNGRVEEVYWTYGYSPVFDDEGDVGGTLVVCTETTARVLSDRRLKLYGALSSTLLTAGSEMAQISALLATALRDAAFDIPFALICTEGRVEHVVGLSGDDAAGVLAACPLGARRERTTLPRPLAAGPWPEPVAEVYVVPLDAPGEALVFGISPRLSLDETYRELFDRVTETYVGARARARLLLEAEAAARAKDEFLAMLGHELRNPLAPILTANQLLKEKLGEPVPREIHILERQARHLVQLVDDLLDVARVAQGKIELHLDRVPLSDVVDRAVDIATPLFEKKGHTLKVELAGGLDVEADTFRLSQVVANLLTNAARYTDAGGHVALRAWREEPDIVLTVEDDGVGIRADQMPRLFEAFFQAPRNRDRGEGGLGLGLAIVKTFTELHGGSVSFRAAPSGRGTVFEVRLPAAEVSESSPPSRSAHAGPHVTPLPRRVLLVDDNEDATTLFAHYLERRGHVVETAYDGPSCLELVEAFRPDVAILDIGLPIMDGYELAARLREALGKATPRLIACTGYGQRADRDASRRAGFNLHLVKPVDPQALLEAVEDRMAPASVS